MEQSVMTDFQDFTPEEFVRHATSSALTLSGFVRFEPANPKVILFGASFTICPFFPIPIEIIQTIRLGSILRCVGPGGRMWIAEIIFKSPIPPEHSARLVELLVQMTELAKQPTGIGPSCTCSEASEAGRPVGCKVCQKVPHYGDLVNALKEAKNKGKFNSVDGCDGFCDHKAAMAAYLADVLGLGSTVIDAILGIVDQCGHCACKYDVF
jgi:hypothetical protein